MKTFPLRLPEDLYAYVKARAGQVGISMNRMIINYIKSRVYDETYHKNLVDIRSARKVKFR